VQEITFTFEVLYSSDSQHITNSKYMVGEPFIFKITTGGFVNTKKEAMLLLAHCRQRLLVKLRDIHNNNGWIPAASLKNPIITIGDGEILSC